MKEGWSNRFLGQMFTGVLMRCRSFTFSSLFTYSLMRYGQQIMDFLLEGCVLFSSFTYEPSLSFSNANTKVKE